MAYFTGNEQDSINDNRSNDKREGTVAYHHGPL